LVLASHALENPAVAEYYEKRPDDEWVVLDNSAHEKKFGESWEVLLEAASLVNPDEIVLPDVLFDAEQTVRRTVEAYNHLRVLEKPFMAVPQGITPDQWWECFRRVDEAVQVDTIGISKDFEVWDGGLPKLLETLLLTWDRGVHLLGWGRDLGQLRTCAQIAEDYPGIRSVDSAKPLVYAHQGIKLDPELTTLTTSPIYPGRPDNYFQLEELNHHDLALHNIEVFRRTASP